MGLAFDAWGKRMQPNGTADPDGQLNPASTDRGFTGHEHLDELGFVHMNGRIDDPLLGRFLSPDPHIQDEGLLQNYNRYSYVLNNPLRYTDPSGEVWWHVAAFIVGAALASSNNRDLKIVGTFLMMWALGPGVGTEPGLLMHAGASKGLAYSLAAGISNTIAYGPEAGLKAGAFAAAFVFVGANIPGAMSPERIIAHAVLGCVQQASSGGQCGPGAAAAAFGKIATGLTQGLGEAAQFAVTTVVGGTVSVIGGGKFANGAAQAGFGYLFNQATGDEPRPGAPALKGDPYHPDSVDKRVADGRNPRYESNPEHGEKLRPNKTPEPKDARSVFQDRAVRVSFDRWIGRSNSGAYYQFFNTDGKVHFAGTLSVDQIRQYGYSKAVNAIDARAHLDSLNQRNAQSGSSWRTAPPHKLGRR